MANKTPNEILKARGSRNARDEVSIGGGFGKAPKTLGEIGKEEWARVTAALEPLGVGSPADRAALECYCSAYQDFHEAIEDIKEHGRVVKTERGMIRNPAFMNKTKAMEMIHKFGTQLGLTPASRGNIEMKPEEEENPFDEFKRAG